MPIIESGRAQAINTAVWRDLGQLAAEALAIGVVFSVLLALAVFVVARNSHGDEFAASAVHAASATPVEMHAFNFVR